MTNLKYWQAINLALTEEMARDDTVCIWGEDVGLAGGPFSATKGLSNRFGLNRVRDTPISEAIIVGAAVGAAMSGLRPVVEIMFLDFITLAMDQLVNQAAKTSYMSEGAFNVPMVVRTLCGAHRGAGPQHSQHLEALVAGIPGLKVAAGSNPADARGLLKSAIRDDDPVVVIESVGLWTMRGEVDADNDALVPLGRAAIVRPGTDVTVVCWAAAVPRSIVAADSLAGAGIEAEVIDLRSLLPLDTKTILESVARTGSLVIVQDSTAPYSVSSEVAAVVASEGFDLLTHPVIRIGAPFAPVPFPPWLEAAYYPGADVIASAVIAMLG
jgi:pyruvate dehydrogenase E1 component beta subunit